MTHSNHRQGTYSNLGNDFVVLARPGREFPDLEARLQQFQHIGSRHQPVNVPGVKSLFSSGHLVYDSKEKVRNLLQDLVTADLGLSITVSGLYNQVEECCHAAGLNPHTVNLSLGFWGKTEQLPHRSILEMTTMCGHGRISPGLVWDLAGQVQCHRLNPGESSRKMGKLCLCNIFNEARATKLMAGLVADIEAGTICAPKAATSKTGVIPRKNFGITIDEDKCISCGECIPYCPVSAIVDVDSNGTVSIDAERCTECGVCWQSGVCPAEAIVAKDLSWPRTLRGKFQNPHAPYRATPMMARVSQPLAPGGTIQLFTSHQFPSELNDDVKGLLRQGETGIVVELGRPHLGTTFRDVQKVMQALLPAGLKLGLQYPPLDERSPLTELTVDIARGVLRQDILEQRTGWVILRLLTPEKERLGVLQNLRRVAGEIDTIFAVNILCRVEKRISTLTDRIAGEIGVKPAANCKTNVGLGRPLHSP